MKYGIAQLSYFGIAGIFFLLLMYSPAKCQNPGDLSGKIIDAQTSAGIPDALIKIEELDKMIKSDTAGYFILRAIPEGSYTLTIQAPGYGRTVILSVPVMKGQIIYQEYFLQKGEVEGEKFYIGGIEVSAQRPLLPEKAATVTTISASEIEHLQASSLGDVLELIPGQRFTNPGLEQVKQIRLRQTETVDEANRNASLGTQIMIDNVPLSNNANMQLDTKLNDGATYRITVNSGVDLRQIPAENIRSVEVIRGIPPARYGDLSSGTVLVETVSGHVPYRLKYKYNPRNKEMNASGGHAWKSILLNFNVNYAHSLRDIRVPGDSFSRLAGQINIDTYWNEKKGLWSNKFYYTRTFDEEKIQEGDLFETERYNRDYTLRSNSLLRYKWTEQKKWEAHIAVNMDRQDSYYKKIVSRDAGVISDRMIPGTQEGIFVSYYTSRLWVKGRAWNFFGRLEYESQTQQLGILHNWQIGLHMQHEFNNGPGREFDPRQPPSSSTNEGDRPRKYDDIPALSQYTLYMQDEIVGHLWRDFNLQMGLRFEFLDPYRWELNRLSQKKFPLLTHHGTFLSPRFNFIQYLSKKSQIRFGYGRNVKVPPLSMVYPNPIYFDIVDSMYYDPNVPENRLAVVTTYIYDATNQNLKAFTQDKLEASFDQRIWDIGISLTGFTERTHNGFELSGLIPVSFTKFYRPNWPELEPAIPRDTILLDYRKAINSVEVKSWGFEFALTTEQIPAINTTIRIDAAYHYSKSWWQKNHFEYASTARQDPYLQQEIRPFWNPTSSWSDNLIIHYRFDTIARSLRLWFTLAIQEIVFERDKYLGLEDSLAVGYIRNDGSIYYIPEKERDDPQYRGIRRTFDEYYFRTETLPNLWLINLRVSKSLWKGSEISFFVNNMLNSQPLFQRQRVPEGSLSYIRRNPEIFYGMEFSMVVDDFFQMLSRY